jgi:hypothetical protein
MKEKEIESRRMVILRDMKEKLSTQNQKNVFNMEKKTPQLPAKPESTLPTLAELFEDSIEIAAKSEGLNAILNANPPDSWVKTHPYIQDYKYLPIDKVEYLLRKIFKYYKIEILREGTAFNGVYVVVKVHYFSPVTHQMEWHDGIGAIQLQTKKGTSPSDLININNGAISMAFPIAKTMAIKDACDHFGNIFGANLNRKDTLSFTPDTNILKSIKSNKEKLNGQGN